MCLSYLYKKIDKSVKFGYKVFCEDNDGSLWFLYFGEYIYKDLHWNSRYSPPINEWIYAQKAAVKTYDSLEEYQTGFHFFKTIQQAQRYIKEIRFQGVIRKIEVDHITASGVQDGIRCMVAQAIKILEEPCV